MKFEVFDLTEENLHDAPEWPSHPFSCQHCIYWEFPELCMDAAQEKKEEMLAKKLEWLHDTRAKFGNCGKLLYADRRAVGYAQYAPPSSLPSSAKYRTGPPSRNAVLISCLFIPQEEFRRLGLGKRLLASIVHDLRQRGVEAVETFARKNSSNNPSGPVDFYLKNGFQVFRDDEQFPLLRLVL